MDNETDVKPIKLLIIDRKIVKKRKNPAITQIINYLKSKILLEVSWILLNPELDHGINDLNFNYKDFEEYETKNTLKILKREKPDLLIISNDYDFIIRSFIPSAKKLKIPIIFLYQTAFFDHYLNKMNSEMMKERISIVNKNVKTLLVNYFSMLKNYFISGYSFSKIFQMILRDISSFYTPKLLWGRYDCDLILVPGESWKIELENKKVKSKVVLTGLLSFDLKRKKISSLKPKITSKKLKLILLTTPFKEHGRMSTNSWELLIKDILSTILPEFSEKFDLFLKIHPTSENKQEYQKIIDDLNLKIPILQSENLTEILFDSDLVISYGYSGAMIDVLFHKKPLIIANFQTFSLNQIPFVKEKLAIEAKNKQMLKNYLQNIPDYSIFKNEFDEFVKKYYFKIDGNSTKRASEAILDLLNK